MSVRRGRSLLNSNMSTASSSGVAVASLSYIDLDPSVKELFQRRPLHPHRAEVLKLRKLVLQRFLMINNHPYKNADNKTQLTNAIMDMVTKTYTDTSTSSTGKTAAGSLVGVPEELVRSLPVESVELLRDMEKRSSAELEALLLDYGAGAVRSESKTELLKQLAELLSEQARAQRGMDARRNSEPSAKRQCVRPECCVCMEQFVSAGFYPCGHAISCMDCASKLKECPMCRKTIENTLHLFFA